MSPFIAFILIVVCLFALAFLINLLYKIPPPVEGIIVGVVTHDGWTISGAMTMVYIFEITTKNGTVVYGFLEKDRPLLGKKIKFILSSWDYKFGSQQEKVIDEDGFLITKTQQITYHHLDIIAIQD